MINLESVKILKDDVKRLKDISKDHGVSPNQFLSDILDEYEEVQHFYDWIDVFHGNPYKYNGGL